MTVLSAAETLDLPYGVSPDPGEYVSAVMEWHFNPETGSPFWLRRAATLDFDPRADVRTFEDLALFPNVTDELRAVPIRELIPAGFGSRPEIVAVIESGGTTGAPKRLPLLRHFADVLTTHAVTGLRAAGVDPAKDWLALMPSGPHGAFEQNRRPANELGVVLFGIDLDPRWVKKVIGRGETQVAAAYVEHIIDQAAFVLREHDVGTVRLTPPILARLSERDELVDLIRQKVNTIGWGGAHMDAESRRYYRTELYPDAALIGAYGTTMALGSGGGERPGLGHDDPCVFDPDLAPYTTLWVVNPDDGSRVPVGERGQLVVHHLSKSFLLPNNAERDMATRVEPSSADQLGDSVADISPLAVFGGTEVVEGVY